MQSKYPDWYTIPRVHISRTNDAYPSRVRMRAATRSADRYNPYRSKRMDYESTTRNKLSSGKKYGSGWSRLLAPHLHDLPSRPLSSSTLSHLSRTNTLANIYQENSYFNNLMNFLLIFCILFSFLPSFLFRINETFFAF